MANVFSDFLECFFYVYGAQHSRAIYKRIKYITTVKCI